MYMINSDTRYNIASDLAKSYIKMVDSGEVKYTCLAALQDSLRSETIERVKELNQNGFTVSKAKYFNFDMSVQNLISDAARIVHKHYYS